MKWFSSLKKLSRSPQKPFVFNFLQKIISKIFYEKQKLLKNFLKKKNLKKKHFWKSYEKQKSWETFVDNKKRTSKKPLNRKKPESKTSKNFYRK